MLCSFSQVRATVSHPSMRTSSIFNTRHVATILDPRAYDPSGLRQESRALGATISGMRHRCRCAVSRITRIRLFRLFFHNGCSQSSRFLPQARRIVGSVDENVSQQVATRWPNARNTLCPTMLRNVTLKCCYRLAGASERFLIDHIRYSTIIARFRGFQDKHLYLVVFSLYPCHLFRGKRNLTNLQV